MDIIALDVGGSSIKHGIVTTHTPLSVVVATTPINSTGSLDEIISTIASIIETYWQTHPAAKLIAFGFPGPFDYVNGISYIQGLAKYEALYGKNIHDLLKQRLSQVDVSIRFRNDAEAAIMGEAIYGTGKGYTRTIGITLGTGIGSAFVVNHRPVVEGAGIPAEGWLFPELYNEQQADAVFSTRGLLKRFAKDGIPANSVVEVDLNTDKVKKALEHFGEDLGQFMSRYTKPFEADSVIVLGGIAHLFTYFAKPFQHHIYPTVLLKGNLGAKSALLGSASMFNMTE